MPLPTPVMLGGMLLANQDTLGGMLLAHRVKQSLPLADARRNAIGSPGHARRSAIGFYLDEFGGLDAAGGVRAVRDHGLWEEELHRAKGETCINISFVTS